MRFTFSNMGVELIGLIPQTGCCCGNTQEVQNRARKIIEKVVDKVEKIEKRNEELEEMSKVFPVGFKFKTNMKAGNTEDRICVVEVMEVWSLKEGPTQFDYGLNHKTYGTCTAEHIVADITKYGVK